MLICPVCHSHNSVEACLASEAGQAYTRLLLQQPDWLRYSLARYVLLFAPAKSQMAYDRRLRLVQQTLALDPDPRRLAAALGETVEAITAKRRGGDVRPLTKHNYLKRVLETVGAQPTPGPPGTGADQGAAGCTPAEARPRGRRAQAIAALEAWGAGDWLRGRIAQGLAALAALGLDGTPGADVITRTADVWHHVLAGSCRDETTDSPRVQQGFSELLKAVETWPEPKAIWPHMPSRPRREALCAPPPSPEEQARARAFFARLAAGMDVNAEPEEN